MSAPATATSPEVAVTEPDSDEFDLDDLLAHLEDVIRCRWCDWNTVRVDGEVCTDCREDAR